MNGYIVTKNGKYCSLNIVVGKTYTCVQDIKDVSMMYQFVTDPDTIFSVNTYKKDVTRIFKVKILGDVKKSTITVYTNKFKVLEEVLPSDYKNVFKSYIFDDEFNLIEDKTNKHAYEYVNGKVTVVKEDGEISAIYNYDERGNLIHYDGLNYQEWYEYDDKNRMIHMKDSIVTEETYEYDEKDNLVHVTTLPSKTEFWRTYDDRGNLTYQKNSLGDESFAQYDSNNNMISFKTSNGDEYLSVFDKDNNLIESIAQYPEGCYKCVIK